MTQISLETVLKLADQLSPQEQKALIEHLQETVRKRELSFQEWKVLFDSIKDDTPVIQDISPRREDWYDDEGR